MSRLQADLALAFAGLVWGFGFVAQKSALDHIGPFTFVAFRFLISALFLLPFVLHERGLQKIAAAMNPKNAKRFLILCCAFSLSVLLQQVGMKVASVTHTAFLTGLYIVMVPFVGRLFHKQALSPIVLLACFISVIGIWLLSGGQTSDLNIDFSKGDGMVLLCTVGFAVHVTVMGRLAKKLQLPFALCFVQCVAVGVIALAAAFVSEHIRLHDILAAWPSILYAAIASGGIAYTLQAVAQQNTPPADAAIIMSLEAVFGGIAGMWFLGEQLSLQGYIGCGTIILAIILVEIGPLLQRSITRKSKNAA